MYKPIDYKKSFDNPADKFSRIFQYIGTNEEQVLTSKCQYFEVDTETSLVNNENKANDQQVVGWSLAPKQSPYSKYAICTHILTDNNTAITGLFETIHRFGCDNAEIYAYFHNLNYDGFFIINWLIKTQGYTQLRGEKLVVKNVLKYEKQYTVLHNDGLLEVRISYKGKCIVLRNSFKLWNSSIDEISQELVKINKRNIQLGSPPSFPLVREKKNLQYDYDAIRKYGEKLKQEEILYMLNDVHVGCAILQMFEKFGGLGVSCSGMAHKIAIKSFQKGVMTSDVVKYLLLKNLKQTQTISNKEFEKYIKLIVRGDKSYIFAKTYYTIMYSELTEKSEEYILSFDTVYTQMSRSKKPVSDISVLMTYKNLNLKQKLIDALKDTSEFRANQSVSDNIVFRQYRLMNPDTFENQIIGFQSLMEQSALDLLNLKNIKSYNYYYDSVFVPQTFEEDKELREAYRGGLSAAIELYSNTMQHNVVSIDINSSYPYQMSERELPYGKPEIYTNPSLKQFEKIKKDFNTYIIKFQTSYNLQFPNVPMITQKNMYGIAKFRYCDTAYRQISDEECLCMTNIEFELFCQTHGVHKDGIIIEKVWAYKSFKGIFRPFVKRMYKIKTHYKGTALYEPVKQMLNSVYGRYGMNRFKYINYETVVKLNTQNIMYYTKEEKSQINYNVAKGSYLPVAIFITSYARVQLIETANAINSAGGKVFYCDTDSLHFTADDIRVLEGYLMINNHKVASSDKINIGEWKIEVCKKVTDGKVIGADNGLYVCSKRYMETDSETGLRNIRYAGVPYKYQSDITYDDIRLGVDVSVNKKVKAESGIILQPMYKSTDFKSNIYKTESGTFLSEFYYNVGEIVEDMYGRRVKITEIIYETKYDDEIKLI